MEYIWKDNQWIELESYQEQIDYHLDRFKVETKYHIQYYIGDLIHGFDFQVERFWWKGCVLK